ncbi:zinc ribbon domain-containing protein [Halobaculum halobium]|uniref:zinc ribbon domain-containing protein n=1 Tax=Halobaculum halobium TaxID=3032281 RepID=UPI002AA2A883|nr:zinc ribbon domain-containing protein [Halobaculum sp. SYNS20]
MSVPTWRRSQPARYRLRAGRCPDCGALAFPRTARVPTATGSSTTSPFTFPARASSRR